jgi:Flp pilus assembly pilin Flp
MKGEYENARGRIAQAITRGITRVAVPPDRIDGNPSSRGAAMVEYALLLVLVLLVAFFSLKVFGETLVAVFDTSSNALDSAPTRAVGS